MIFKGKVYKYYDNIDIDVIIFVRYFNIFDLVEFVKYCLEDLDKEFVNKV